MAILTWINRWLPAIQIGTGFAGVAISVAPAWKNERTRHTDDGSQMVESRDACMYIRAYETSYDGHDGHNLKLIN